MAVLTSSLKRFLSSKPGGVELARSLVRQEPYRERWARLQGWLEAAGPKGTSPHGEGPELLVISTLPYWIDYSLAMSVCLVAQGANITFGWFPYQSLQRKDSWITRIHDQVARRFRSPNRTARLEVLNLLQVVEAELPPELVMELESQSRIDAAYITRRQSIDLENEEHARIYEHRLARNCSAAGRIVALIRNGSYDALLTPHGNLLEFGVARRVAVHMGLTPITFESWEQENSMIAAVGDPCVRLDAHTDEAWRGDEPHELNKERKRRIAELVKLRRTTSWEGFTYTYQRAISRSAEEIARELLIDPKRPVVLMCPNISWDNLHWEGSEAAYPTMMEWVRATVRWFAGRPECQLIIRSHPSEDSFFATEETVAVALAEELSTIPAHFRVLKPSDPVNTYDLMDLATFGITYVSTTGLEMLMRGIPVAVGGPAHYRKKGFTRDVSSEADYYALLQGLCDSPERLTNREIELAWCYMDVFLFRWTRPYPWSIATFEKDIVEWPIERVLSDEGRARFGATFDFLEGHSASRPGTG